MALKFLLFALLVVYSAQGLEAKSVSISEERGIVDEIQKLVQAAIELVRTTVDQIKGVLKDLYDALQETAKQEIEKALAALRELHDKAIEALKKLVAEAGDLSKEVQSCVDAKSADIVDAYNKAQDGSMQCVSASKKIVERAVGSVGLVVQQSVETLQVLLKEFKECEKVLCQVGVVTKAIDAIPKIKDAVLAAAADAREVIAAEIPVFTDCSAKVAEEYQKSMDAIRADIMECVNNIKN